MSWQLYIGLSVMMFLEFAIWGAWAPVLAARLLGPLSMSGKQTGWIYGTIPIACIISPLAAGQLCDRWIATEWLLSAAQIVGGVLLLVAARKKTFGGLFTVMGVYSLCYAGTLPLVNSLMFSQLGKVCVDNAAVNAESAKIFIWAPIAWVLAGLLLTGWRRAKGSGDGSDCLIFAGILSLVMGVFCLSLPHTLPAGKTGDALPFVKAFGMLSDGNFLLFLVLSFVVTAQLQFYYLGTAQYLGDIGVESKNVPAAMTTAQAVQTVATWFALGYLVNKLGFHWTLAIGATSWLVMYLLYTIGRPRWLVIISQGFHGIAYVLFIIAGQIYVNSVAPEDIRGSAQALLFVVTMGFGFLSGTQFTGAVMDRFKKEGKFEWRRIFIVPCALMIACAIGFVLFFKG